MGKKEKASDDFLIEDALSLNRKLFLADNRKLVQEQIDRAIYDFTSKWSLMVGPGIVMSAPYAEAYIRQRMSDVEEHISRLCARHSKYFWLCLARRIPPWPEDNELESTQLLGRCTFELAILKYGSMVPDPFIKVPFGIDPRTWVPISEEAVKETGDKGYRSMYQEEHNISIVPASITSMDWTDLHIIREFAFLYYSLTAILRRVWKGEMLEITSRWNLDSRPTHIISRLMEIWDKRANEQSDLLSPLGHPITEKIQPDSQGENMMFLLKPNASKTDLAYMVLDILQNKAEGKPPPIPWFPNYIPYIFDFAKLESWFERYGPGLESVYECKWQYISSFLYALVMVLSYNIREAIVHNKQDDPRKRASRFYSILQRGYLVSDSMANLKGHLSSIYEEKLSRMKFGDNASDRRKVFDQLVDRYTSSYGEDTTINLWTRTGRKLFIRDGGMRCITDYSALGYILKDILQPLGGMDGEIGNIRGTAFPEYVRDNIMEMVEGAVIWFFQEELRFNDNKRNEIDIGIQYNDTLFIIECANMSRDSKYDMGLPKVIKNRMNALDNRINKLDTISTRLAAQQTGNNWALPQNTRWIVSLVTTPGVEYLTSFDDKYWLTSDLPRVCTPNELISFIKEFKATEYTSKPWMLPVS